MIILSLLLLGVAFSAALFGLMHDSGTAVWFAEALFVVSLGFFLLAQSFVHKRRLRAPEKENSGANEP